ncbi:MAG TPA: 3-alpha-hydroxysteroid dehydrogenase [Balneola sp.]|jgi:3alpha(or 20beta)-hydroxysteroid dehydrogenase|nr:3-alpha-hydroxysteroid dehydrogenase [Bacteroidota bacterium]MAC06055.1 3-alpha-hydroxysteroid dehydrogenase [Balneola sp.]MAO77854.1 3-alpha-hydroxysteroid dehydrogenase [Balneola sp.]MBF63308.1 3-alpha-hydroxysteroid dehydrogenase [Balneola sp.]HAW78942.1 3-alpha-hydroxysteroid dehydrogenase [Balneola sp.]|tara:strand:- start:2677 stop:3423 length:747 start_codon:yes stop_codon:yes gene_type:complete
MKRLENKVAIITGASQGMGESHARSFVAEGAKVVMTDINEVRGAEIADELGENAIFIKHDVTKPEEWKKVVSESEATFGPINVLVNNAGVLGPIAEAIELKEDEYSKVIAINQNAIFYGIKYVLPSMLKAGIGSIVNISSIAGIVAIYGYPSLAYMSSKFAVRGMTKAVAIEYASKNIRANSVHPGFIKTPMMAAATDEEGGEATGMIPLGRLAETKEVSDLVVFLSSDESSYMTGTEQIIDGGMSVQ